MTQTIQSKDWCKKHKQIFEAAVKSATTQFDEEASCRAARKLFPAKSELEQRVISYEILFDHVLRLLGLTQDAANRYESEQARIEAKCKFGHQAWETEKELSIAQKSLKESQETLTEERLLRALGQRDTKSVEEAEAATMRWLERIEALQAKLSAAKIGDLELCKQRDVELQRLRDDSPLLQCFSEYKVLTLCDIREKYAQRPQAVAGCRILHNGKVVAKIANQNELWNWYAAMEKKVVVEKLQQGQRWHCCNFGQSGLSMRNELNPDEQLIWTTL
jgi:hypothetical protein